MKVFATILLYLITCFSISFCSSGNKKEEFDKGKVIEIVKCVNDTTQSYALYLPSCYNTDKNWPAIYVFDSHARGKMPVEKYKNLAEKYGYILIGSNNSKNGLPWEVTGSIANTMLNDTYGRFAIDKRRVYTMGFSGGARVASSVAIFNGGVNGVIGCAAGFPNLDQPISNTFDYISIVGNEDFNYLELKNLDNNLNNSDINHHLIVFDGEHDWPSEQIMNDAFIWLEVNAMKDNLILRNDFFLEEFINHNDTLVKTFLKQGDLLKAYDICKKVIKYLDGLYDVTPYKNTFTQLEQNKGFQTMIKHQEEIEKNEIINQQKYLPAITTKDISWWENEVSKFNQQIKDGKDREKSLSDKRVLNYLSLAAYMNSIQALNANDLVQASQLLKIYKLVDADNPESSYLSAQLFVKTGDMKNAIAALEDAVKIGFEDVERLQNDIILQPLKNKEEFKKIIEQIKNSSAD